MGRWRATGGTRAGRPFGRVWVAGDLWRIGLCTATGAVSATTAVLVALVATAVWRVNTRWDAVTDR